MKKSAVAEVVKSVNKEGRPFLESLRKQGDTLRVADITYSVLLKLWADELASDREIAKIFNTTPDVVRGIRHSFGITNETCINMHISKAFQTLGFIGGTIMAIRAN